MSAADFGELNIRFSADTLARAPQIPRGIF